MDYEGIESLLRKAEERFPHLSQLWLEAGYRGEGKGADWVEKALGWTVDLLERPKKPAPREGVLMAWSRQWAKEGVAVDWQKLIMLPESFVVLPRGGGWLKGRSVMERPKQEDEQRLREVNVRAGKRWCTLA